MGRYQVRRTDAEIDKVLNTCIEREGSGRPTLWHGMTYEQGVEAAIRWLIGEIDEDPVAEEE